MGILENNGVKRGASRTVPGGLIPRLTALSGKLFVFQALASLLAPTPTLGDTLFSYTCDYAAQVAADAAQSVPAAAASPASDRTPRQTVAYFQIRLARNPADKSAMKGLARAQAEMKDFAGAIRTYQKWLEAEPADRDARLELARVLGWNRQYDDSIRLYREILASAPDDIEVLEGLAHVYAWSDHSGEAIHVYQRLMTLGPSNRSYRSELARLQLQHKDYSAARALLNSLLSTDPHDREARLQLARIEVQQRHFEPALKQFEQVLDRSPDDFDALFGKAQVSYYLGRLNEAHTLAEIAIKRRPDNYDAVFLLASVERARGKRQQAFAQLAQADRLSPHNPEVASMRKGLQSETKFTLHTAASYDREIGQPGAGKSVGFGAEDLRTFGSSTTIGMSFLPRSDSFLAMSYSSADVPRGYFGGSAGPAEFFYRQKTEVTPVFTLHGGIGLTRFGGGFPVNLPNGAGPQPSATERPTGLLGGAYSPRKNLNFAFTWSRASVPATPLSVRLGVIESRTSGKVSYSPTSGTELSLEYYRLRDSSVPYHHLIVTNLPAPAADVIVNRSDTIQGSGGSIVFDQGIVHSAPFSLNAGYSAEIYGYDGPRRGVFLGYFSPSFYQQHLLTTKLAGKIWGGLGYDFKGGIGLQQVNHNAALMRALIVNPALNWKVNARLALSLGYTHYDVAQALGVVRGNGVQLSTDWKF